MAQGTPASQDSSMARGGMIIDALIAAGVGHIVLAPGSRSAPLALAAAAAERAGRIRLHVRIDERSAAFLALGLAKGSGAPVAVVTTSGTAAVNLHPAVVEASYGGVPLIAVTADRPERLRGVGANQTIEQAGLFGSECRFACDLTAADVHADAEAIRRAIESATDPMHPGPAHVNVALDEPLVSTEPSVPRESAVPAMTTPRSSAVVEPAIPGDGASARGVIVVGDTAGFPDDAAAPELIDELAERTGWPIISEPSGNASRLRRALRHGPLIVDDEDFVSGHVPDVIVSIGRVGLHRGVMRLIARAGCHWVVDPRPTGYACDPLRTARAIWPSLPQVTVLPDPGWWEAWHERDDAWALRVESAWPVSAEEPLDGVRIARTVVAHLTEEDTLVVGPSWPVRHVSAFAGPIQATVAANRGTSGIDGVMSTAWGIAASTQRFTVALVGDLTSIYDRNGLLAAPGEEHPHLVYVVVDNDGGGIFGELEQADPAFAVDYERVFGTPHGARLADLLRAPGITGTSVVDEQQMRDALGEARAKHGVHIVIASTMARAEQVHRVRGMTADHD